MSQTTYAAAAKAKANLLEIAFTALSLTLLKTSLNEAFVLPFKKLWIYTCLAGKVNTVSN